jgi:uncharacterized membrane protein YbhN (UPF0104 family)
VVSALVLFVWRVLDGVPLAETFTAERLRAVALTQPILLVAILCSGRRLAILASAPWGGGVRAMVLGAGLNLALPGRLGEVVKASYLSQVGGTPLAGTLAAVLMERLMDLVIVGVLGVLAVLVVLGTTGTGGPVVAVVAIAALLSVRWLAPLGRAVVQRLPWPGVRAFATQLLERLIALQSQPRAWRLWLLGAATWCASWASIHALLHLACSRPLTPGDTAFVFVASTFGLAVPLLPGGLGTYESAATAALRLRGVPLEEAVTLAILLRLQQFVLFVGWSAVLAIRERRLLGELVRGARGGDPSHASPRT